MRDECYMGNCTDQPVVVAEMNGEERGICENHKHKLERFGIEHQPI